MQYIVTADRDDADSSDTVIHNSMVDAVKDMVSLGKEPADTGGPIGWVLELATKTCL